MSLQAKGLFAWLIQRISAVYLLVSLTVLLYVLFIAPPDGYAQWQAWFSQPLINAASALFFIMLFVHAWVGLRDVIMDYISTDLLRVLLLTLLAGTLLLLALWVFRSLLIVL